MVRIRDRGAGRLATVLGCALLVAILAPRAAGAQPFGAWLTLDGSPGYVEVPHSPALNPGSALTVEAWVAISPGSGCRSLVGKDFLRSYWLGVCGSTLRSFLRGSATAPVNGGTVPPFQWTHVAVVFDGLVRRHYVNGELAVAISDPGPLPASVSPLRIGSDVALAASPAGSIDEVRLWNVARNTGQIRADLNVAITTPRPGLVAVWSLDAGGDDALGAHDGTVHGAAGFLTFPVTSGCTPTPTSLCLHGRFIVSVSWRDFADNTGVGKVVPCGTTDSGLFWFFSPTNWELMVKVLNGCTLNARWWAFSAATTNVFYRLEVFDVVKGANKIYFNYLGISAPAVTDTAALSTCP